MNDDIIEKMDDIEKSIDRLTQTIQNAVCGTTDGMGVVEMGFALNHDRLARIADALELIANRLSK